MSREILFRGKCVDNGEWVYGYYIVAGDRPLNTMNKYFEIIGNIHEEV